MSRAAIINVYPNNPVIDAGVLNSQYGAFNTATTNINETNVGFEGIDTRQITGSPVLVYGNQFTNSYFLSGPGATPAAGSLYRAVSDPAYASATSETPINHDSTGTKTTVIGNGTKWNLNVGQGITIKENDIIRIDLDINAWTIQEQIAGVADDPLGVLPAADRGQLVNGVGGQTVLHGGNYGSGMGEWFYLIYPKVNITAATGLDANYQTLGTAFGIVGNPDFGAINKTSAAVNPPPAGSFVDLQDDFDHTLILPIHHMNASANTSRPSFMPYYEGHMNTAYGAGLNNYDMPPLRDCTSIVFKALNKNPVTLYSIQLYISGIYRLARSGNTPVAYLEGQDCNPALGGQHFGLSTGVYLEECRWGIQVFRSVT